MHTMFCQVSVAYVTEEMLRNTIAIEFTNLWHPYVTITSDEIVLSGCIVSTERMVKQQKCFSLRISPFQVDNNTISFHILEIIPRSQETIILNLLNMHPNLDCHDHVLYVRLLPCDFNNPFFRTLRYLKLREHEIFIGLSL